MTAFKWKKVFSDMRTGDMLVTAGDKFRATIVELDNGMHRFQYQLKRVKRVAGDDVVTDVGSGWAGCPRQAKDRINEMTKAALAAQ